jgi:hypothetical protein
MNSHERELARQVAKLKKVIRKLVLTSRDFDALRKLLREGGFELQVYLIPLVLGQEHLPAEMEEDEMRFELTKDDRTFLRRAGIRFE